MRLQIVLIVALLLPAAGCFESVPTEKPSAIVAYAEVHGSGELRLGSTASIQLWVRTHKTLGGEIFRMCQALPPGDATWGDTTEGHLCLAVKRESFWGFGEKAAIVPDRRNYDPIGGVR